MHPVAAQHLSGACRGPDLEAQVGQALDREHHRALVLAGHRDERAALDRQRPVRGGLGLRERGAEHLVQAHDLAGGAHFGPEHGVDALASRVAEPAERQHCLLDRDRRVQRQRAAVTGGGQQAFLAQPGHGRAQHDPGGRLGQRHRGRLGDERHGAGRARIRLQHVQHPAGQGVLHVQQPAHAHAAGDRLGRAPDLGDVLPAQGDRRQRAGRVAGVDAGLLDVLHHAAQIQFLAVVQGVDVDLDRVVEEPVDQHRVLRAGLGGPAHVSLQRHLVVDDLHAAAAEHVGGPDQHRVADLAGYFPRVGHRLRDAVPRGQQPGRRQHRAELAPVLGQVNGVRRRADHRNPLRDQVPGQAERRLPAELDDHPGDRPAGLLGGHHLEHVLQRERLEVQPVGGVVVGGDGLRVAVHHHGLVADLGQGERRVHAGVVELDALADAVRPAAEDDHLGAITARHLGLLVVGRVQVRCARRELGGARVHREVHRPDARRVALPPDLLFGRSAELSELRVREPGRLGRPQLVRAQRPRARHGDPFCVFLDVFDLIDEPWVDPGGVRQLSH